MSTKPEAKKLVRPPVVVVMGHVDHGKTTLLDFIRKANVADKEAGGITQTVGAYEIEHPSTGSGQASSNKITFIDTPGHQAFKKMRERGARMADIAILIVAADDGVNTQTKEVIEILNETKIPFLVAINKIDKNNANEENAKISLSQNGVMLEGFGGSVSFQPISAKTGQGVNELLDLVLLQAELENFTYDQKAPLEAYILEAKKDSFTGVSATVIIKNGTLRMKDDVHTASARGKIKSLKNFLGKPAKELTASSPAVISGLDNLPEAGERLFDNSDVASQVEEKSKKVLKNNGVEQKNKDVINFVLKAQDAGSLEALSDAICSLPHPDPEQKVQIIASGVGKLSEGDIKMAISTDAYVVAFNVKTGDAANNLIEAHKVKVFDSDIIYKILEGIEEEFSGHKKQMIEAELEVLAVFNQENNGAQVIGGKVLSGELKEQREMEIHRRETKVGDGKITNLQCSRKEVPSVKEGNECGILFSSQVQIKKGDHLIQRPE